MSKIFISIASYRDPELLPTLRSCIENAKYPNKLTFGICWQRDETESLEEFTDDSRFKVIKVPYDKSKGTCWARNMIQELWSDETYYLQLDSHHRFAKDWDATLIKMLKALVKKGHKKPLLTSYLPGFDPKNDPASRINECWSLEFDRYLPEGPIFIKPHVIENWRKLKSPIPSKFLSGHFIFTLGQWAKEVRYDPYYYFHGEEPSLAARSYTHGYDLFHPNEVVIWHEYIRSGKTKQWDDDKEWANKNSTSYSRYRALHGMGGELPDTLMDLEKYGWGTERSLEDYEKYIGVKFSTRQVHKHTADYHPLPVPLENFDEHLLNKIKVCIDVYKGSLPENDYDNFVIAILDENGNDIHRQDSTTDEIMALMNSDPNDQFIHLWREYNDNKQPTSWRVWPHSVSKGWCDRIETAIKYD
jgi:glycosyltransferase involved in cell wall biosynthesis